MTEAEMNSSVTTRTVVVPMAAVIVVVMPPDRRGARVVVFFHDDWGGFPYDSYWASRRCALHGGQYDVANALLFQHDQVAGRNVVYHAMCADMIHDDGIAQSCMGHTDNVTHRDRAGLLLGECGLLLLAMILGLVHRIARGSAGDQTDGSADQRTRHGITVVFACGRSNRGTGQAAKNSQATLIAGLLRVYNGGDRHNDQ